MKTAMSPSGPASETATGAWLVLGSAVIWSFGGVLARLAEVDDPWVIVFWRTLTASLFILGFLLFRDGPRGAIALARNMGVPGLVVAACFATAMTSFIVALNYTTIANILLMQAAVPLIAALISRLAFGEAVGLATWIAIAAVIFGVGVMVSDSLTGGVSLIGDALALLITLVFAVATVVSRRHANVRMTPAVLIATMTAFAVATATGLVGGSDFAVSGRQFAILAVFGVSLGLGLAIFTIGVRLIPSAFAALLGTGETVLGPVWAWLILAEVPKARTLLGGGIVLAALIAYLVWQLRQQRRGARPNVSVRALPDGK